MNVGESNAVGITSDVPATNTTLVSAGLSFAVGAGESYHFLYTLSCTSTNLAGFEFNLVAPNCSGNFINTSSTSASVGVNGTTTGLSPNTQYGKQGTFQETHSNTISGIITNGGGATTCDLQFAQNTTNGTPSKVKGGSSVLYTRIA